MGDNRPRVGELTYYCGLDDLATVDSAQRVAWFKERFARFIERPLREVQVLGRDSPSIWDLNLGVVTIICSAIEALGSFYKPKAKDAEAFDSFVREFMNPVYQRLCNG